MGIPTATPSPASRLAYCLVPIRRKTVLENMRLVFGPEASEASIRALAQRFYGHLGRCIYENFSIGFTTDRRLKDSVRLEGHEKVIEAAKLGQGVLLFTGHFGNWEIAPVGGLMHFSQFKGKFHVVRRRLVNKFVERMVFSRFYNAGLNVIPKKDSIDLVLEALERNEVVTFIMDQHAKPGKDGLVVNFFGQPAGTFKSLAVIARSTGAPVLPMMCYRDTDGTHVMRFEDPLPWLERDDPDAELHDNTRAYNAALERMVLAHPEQWWWVHKRWKIK